MLGRFYMHLLGIGVMLVLAGVGIGMADSISKDEAPGSGHGVVYSPGLESLSSEFKDLRRIPGHFGGGQWDERVDSWQGRKHAIMLELAALFPEDFDDVLDLHRIMGPPDRIIKRQDPLYEELHRLVKDSLGRREAEQFQAYYWRGQHDFIFFAEKRGRVLCSGWWHALE